MTSWRTCPVLLLQSNPTLKWSRLTERIHNTAGDPVIAETLLQDIYRNKSEMIHFKSTFMTPLIAVIGADTC